MSTTTILALILAGFALGPTRTYASSSARATPTVSPSATPYSEAFDQKFFENYFDEPFFSRSTDPFQEMRRFRDLVLNDMNSPAKNQSAFNTWFAGRYGGDVADIQKREDKKHVYYDVMVKDMKDEKVSVSVKDGYVTIKGSLQKKSDDSTETDTFTRMFPAPINVDRKHVEIDQRPGKIIVKFTKIFA